MAWVAKANLTSKYTARWMLRNAAMQDNNEDKDNICQRYPRSCLHLPSYGGFFCEFAPNIVIFIHYIFKSPSCWRHNAGTGQTDGQRTYRRAWCNTLAASDFLSMCRKSILSPFSEFCVSYVWRIAISYSFVTLIVKNITRSVAVS